jgi:hypothetical protein
MDWKVNKHSTFDISDKNKTSWKQEIINTINAHEVNIKLLRIKFKNLWLDNIHNNFLILINDYLNKISWKNKKKRISNLLLVFKIILKKYPKIVPLQLIKFKNTIKLINKLELKYEWDFLIKITNEIKNKNLNETQLILKNLIKNKLIETPEHLKIKFLEKLANEIKPDNPFEKVKIGWKIYKKNIKELEFSIKHRYDNDEIDNKMTYIGRNDDTWWIRFLTLKRKIFLFITESEDNNTKLNYKYKWFFENKKEALEYVEQRKKKRWNLWANNKIIPIK